MRPCVTLQLPAGPPGAAINLRGASVLLLGRGYVAKALSPRLINAGAKVQFTSREAGPCQFGSAEMRRAFERADVVLSSISPSKDGMDPALGALAGATTSARWIGYLSATSVYGDRNGQWAFEGEAPTPGLSRGFARANAELAWLETHAATQIFRLAGIYGTGRAPFRRIQSGKARIVDAPGHIVNRIHVDDIVSALLASIARPSPQDIYNLADGHPAPPGDVMRHAANLIGAASPPTVDINDSSVSDMARTFYAESKRINIHRAKKRLAWEPLFKDYKTGLNAILETK